MVIYLYQQNKAQLEIQNTSHIMCYHQKNPLAPVAIKAYTDTDAVKMIYLKELSCLESTEDWH